MSGSPRCFLLMAVLMGSSCLLAQGYSSDGAMAQLVNLCSNIEVRALASSYSDLQGYRPKAKRSSIWFGPRMGKREPSAEYLEPEFNSVSAEELLGNIHGLLKRELDEKLGPDSQWVVYLVNEHPNKYMTPRMGRELSERCLELQMVKPPMGPRMGRTL